MLVIEEHERQEVEQAYLDALDPSEVDEYLQAQKFDAAKKAAAE